MEVGAGGLVLIFILFLFLVLALSDDKSTPGTNQDEKDSIVLELLSGKISIEELARREGVSVDDIKAWREEFINNSAQYSKNRQYLEQLQFQYERDIKWFEGVCQKYIGADWKEKTGYNNRNR